MILGLRRLQIIVFDFGVSSVIYYGINGLGFRRLHAMVWGFDGIGDGLDFGV